MFSPSKLECYPAHAVRCHTCSHPGETGFFGGPVVQELRPRSEPPRQETRTQPQSPPPQQQQQQQEETTPQRPVRIGAVYGEALNEEDSRRRAVTPIDEEHNMPGQLGNVKPRKRKSGSDSKTTRKASSRKSIKGPKSHLAAESSSADGGHALEKLSCISCECHQAGGRKRCSASPQLGGQDGKENELRTDSDGCRLNGSWEKQAPEQMDYEETSKNFFPDEDSNQILPVEQFFGNLDVVQDFPQRSSVTSARVRRENRRRYYYALDDSDEEEVALAQGDDRRDT